MINLLRLVYVARTLNSYTLKWSLQKAGSVKSNNASLLDVWTGAAGPPNPNKVKPAPCTSMLSRGVVKKVGPAIPIFHQFRPRRSGRER